MRHRSYQNCCILLGMIAMLGTLVSMPLTATYAFAMSGQTTAMAMDAPHTMDMSSAKAPMPCDGPAKHCPNCPQKVCPEMGSCLVKCFQPLPSPLAEARFHGEIKRDLVAPGYALITAGSLIPPLLRPPSV